MDICYSLIYIKKNHILQDTIVAQQALGEYAAATKQESTDLHYTIKDLNNPDKTSKGHITDDDLNREIVIELVCSI